MRFLAGILFLSACVSLTAVGFSSFIYGSGFTSISLDLDASAAEVSSEDVTYSITVKIVSFDTSDFVYNSKGIEDDGVCGTKGSISILFYVDLSNVYSALKYPTSRSSTIVVTVSTTGADLISGLYSYQTGSSTSRGGVALNKDVISYDDNDPGIEIDCPIATSYCKILLNFDFSGQWSTIYDSLSSSGNAVTFDLGVSL